MRYGEIVTPNEPLPFGWIKAASNQLVISTPATIEQAEVFEGLRFARYHALEEFPGLVFGVMTVAYIVLSLAKLAL